jgi:sulfite reductase (NADPH) hemoprotein beta-component
MLTGLRRIASLHDGDFRITPNQNLVIANVAEPKRAEIERIASDHGLLAPRLGLRRNSMACVALPTCGLALAESERYLPDLVLALEERLATHGIEEDDIVIRMTGCPNGCARPYLAEIGLVGTGPGRYNLYLGGTAGPSRPSKAASKSSAASRPSKVEPARARRRRRACTAVLTKSCLYRARAER